MVSIGHNSFLFNALSFLKWERKYVATSKSHYYQSRLNRIDSWEKLYRITNDKNKPSVFTNQSILFYNIPFGTNQKKIVSHFGKPRHKLDNSAKIKGHEVYFYKFNFYGIIAKCEIHFINKSFFLASYFFNRTMDGVSKEVLDTIIQKYINVEEQIFEHSLQLEDIQKNKLIVENDVDYVVTYLSGDASLYECITNQILEIENQKAQSQQLRKDALRKAL